MRPPPPPPHPPRKAILALFLVTLIWGGTFVWMKQGLAAASSVLGPDRPTAGIALFTGLRFGSAALLLALLVPAARKLDRAAWRGGLILGGLLFTGFVLQMFGLEDVTPAVSAFLTSLYVLFTALLTALIARRALGWPIAAGVVLATLGAGWIRGRPELAFNGGELLTVACALVFAMHILATDRITRRIPAMPVTLTSFLVVTIGSAALYAVSPAFDAPSATGVSPSADLAAVLASADFVGPLALASVLATVLAISLMNLYQRELDPVRAAILYALEPVWAAMFGVWAGHDVADRYLWLGGGLLLAGNLIAELAGQRARRAATAA